MIAEQNAQMLLRLLVNLVFWSLAVLFLLWAYRWFVIVAWANWGTHH